MTDTTTETRALIARVRTDIAPADQPQALRDLARTADGEPRVDAGMLRREAASLEAGDDATLADYVREDAFDFRAHLVRQREWSERTFGPGPRPAGLIDHIQKELREIEAAPDDLEEWIDVAILAFDGAWRAGYSPDEIIAQLVAKQSKNERREWPDWRVAEFGKAIEHVRDDAREDAKGGE